MADYQSVHSGVNIDDAVTSVLNGTAGIQGVKVNGTDLTPDSGNKVNVVVPTLLQTTGTSTTSTMSQNAITTSLAQKADTSDLSQVATTGAYSDLSGRPNLSAVATTGAYSDLSGKPNLATVATTGAYSDLNGKPNLATVATTGAYADLTGTPTVPSVTQNTGTSTTSVMSQNAVTVALGAKADTSSLATVATTGAYSDLSGTPTVPSVVQATGSSTANVMSQNAVTLYLNNKADSSSLATVATTGSYNDLLNKPSVATKNTYTATFYSNSWSANAPYTQTVSVSGILATDTPITDVVLSNSSSTAAQELSSWGNVSKITTAANEITATCFDEVPTVNLNIQMLVIR